MATMGPLALTFFCMLWGSGSMGLELLGAGSDLTQDLFMAGGCVGVDVFECSMESDT